MAADADRKRGWDPVDAVGAFFGGWFDRVTRLFNWMGRVFDVLEEAFDNAPIFRPVALLALIGLLVYYVLFFNTFDPKHLMAFVYFFVGGTFLVALILIHRFAEVFEPCLICRAATRKRREDTRKMLETQRVMRKIVKKKRRHPEITAHDVLVPREKNEPK